MISIDKPSVSPVMDKIDILPGDPPSSQLSPLSKPQPSYRFDLTALPPETVSTLDADLVLTLNRLLTLSQHLAIPTLFASGDGQAWVHSQQHYPALLVWKEQQVPTLLAEVDQLLSQLDASKTSGNSEPVELVVGQVVCAVVRYLPIRCIAVDCEHHDGWTSDRSSITARSILSSLAQQSSSKLPHPSTISESLLSDYIKPIFRETSASSCAPSSSIDAATGRAKPRPPGSRFISHFDANLGQHRFQSVDQDTSASDLVPQRFGLHLAEATGGEAAADRNEALGCVNVLAWCLENLSLETESVWANVWPLIVPPLLTLLEHPQPRFRTRGSQIVHALLSRPTLAEGEAKRCQSAVLGQLLVRTGIGSLLERALHVNLTYIHDEAYAAGLVAHSMAALRRLVVLTTDPIVFVDHGEGGGDAEAGDCGQRRMESLFNLISEGVLSTWSYLPIPPSGTRHGLRLVNVTCTAYLELIDDVSPSSTSIGGAARFLDVSLDWIFRNWLSHVAFDQMDQIESTRIVLRLADRLLVRPPMQLKRLTGTMLVGVAKCFISARESHLRSNGAQEWQGLQVCLSSLLRKLAQSDATIEPRWFELVQLDSRLGDLLPRQ